MKIYKRTVLRPRQGIEDDEVFTLMRNRKEVKMEKRMLKENKPKCNELVPNSQRTSTGLQR